MQGAMFEGRAQHRPRGAGRTRRGRLMATPDTVDGLTYDNVRHNVYAHTQDLKRFTRKRDAARLPHRRQYWETKRQEAQRYLEKNTARLARFHASVGGADV